MTERPIIAIVDPNTLAVMGMRQMLQHVMPIMSVEAFSTFDDLLMHDADRFVHFFVAQSVVLEHRPFFLERRHKTIVTTPSLNPQTQLGSFHSLCINQPEEELVRDLLHLVQGAHGGGRNLPPMPHALNDRVLSDRETEVLSLIAQGRLNKQIADQLHISLSTVVSHRKNIQEKLGMKSVSALTIYAVMHGYVDVNRI
jgi:DNA-binding CsgD family transcriptional regulator